MPCGAALICLVLAALLAGFARWGLSRSFNEMAGMIPFAAGVLSALLTIRGHHLGVLV